MKKTLYVLIFLYALAARSGQPWKLSLTCPEEKVDLVVDLYEESVEVPSMEDFGPMNGYLSGNIYGVWYVTSFKIEDARTATIKLANDLGSENQRVQLTQLYDTLWQMKLMGTNVVRRVSGKKLVKVPDTYLMKRKR